ncbi:1-(5-phosphoribosyl)-5-[(5-phosphoribosylamino)methylideneamino]imidazole-4-carboxamide isomerase [Pelagibacteraceae bacterium]|nr:1-(5-phosphoribosyl)-5-[(5-phosphoribosylamino)methylideneamino]imidazole-4-carboxamide isomerase [Pelagibacteraceae bacterium]
MLIIPAIDLKDNKCVRLTEGIDNSSVVFNTNPEKQAIFFQEIGCKKLHIVDLDGAFGRAEINLTSIKKIRKAVSIPIQLGGGIRTISDAERYFDLGINNLIIGSMSVNSPEQTKLLLNKYNNKIYISLDIKGGNVMVRGWEEKSKLTIKEILNFYKDEKIKGYILTDIENDGMLKGINTNFIKNMIDNMRNNNEKYTEIIFAGGLTNYEDLKKIKKLDLKNVKGIIAGKSFYVGNIDLKKAQNILDAYG